MKRIVLLAPFLLLFSCSQDDDPPSPGPGNNPGDVSGKFWIPNWAKDTLVGISNEADPQTGDFRTDVIYSFSKGDTSMINYKGVDYYIWTESQHYIENDDTYGMGKISESPFGANIFAEAVAIVPHKYYDTDYQKWYEQDQALLINMKPPFPDDIVGNYSTMWKNFLD